MSLFFLLYLSPLSLSLSLQLSSSSLIVANLRRYRSCHQSHMSLSMSQSPSSALSISTSFTLSFSSISLFQTNLLISTWVMGPLIFFFFSFGYGEFQVVRMFCVFFFFFFLWWCQVYLISYDGYLFFFCNFFCNLGWFVRLFFVANLVGI